MDIAFKVGRVVAACVIRDEENRVLLLKAKYFLAELIFSTELKDQSFISRLKIQMPFLTREHNRTPLY